MPAVAETLRFTKAPRRKILQKNMLSALIRKGATVNNADSKAPITKQLALLLLNGLTGSTLNSNECTKLAKTGHNSQLKRNFTNTRPEY